MYLVNLQILRALAATFVMYFHLGNSNFQFGSFGVDTFFVISGFVMATVISNGESSTLFIKNRLLRIIPLYWLLTSLLLFVTILTPSILNSTSFNMVNYIKSLLFIPYFKENGALHPMLTVGWSLNYEMFFYFTIWLSISVYRKFWMFVTCFIICVTHFGVSFFDSQAAYSHFFSNSIILEFCLGLLSYYLYTYLKHVSLNPALLSLTATLSLFLMIYFELGHHETNRLYLFGLPSFFIVLALALFEAVKPIKQRNWFVNLGVKLGDSSYALYLSHTFSIEALKKIVLPTLGLSLDSRFTLFFAIVISIAVGHIIFLYIDKPITNLLKKHLIQYA